MLYEHQSTRPGHDLSLLVHLRASIVGIRVLGQLSQAPRLVEAWTIKQVRCRFVDDDSVPVRIERYRADATHTWQKSREMERCNGVSDTVLAARLSNILQRGWRKQRNFPNWRRRCRGGVFFVSSQLHSCVVCTASPPKLHRREHLRRRLDWTTTHPPAQPSCTRRLCGRQVAFCDILIAEAAALPLSLPLCQLALQRPLPPLLQHPGSDHRRGCALHALDWSSSQRDTSFVCRH